MARILLVEDNRDTIELLRGMLAGIGYQGLVATSATRAIGSLDKRQISAILVGLRQLDADNSQLIKQLRSRTSVPIIVVSSNVSSASLLEAVEEGADDCVVMPCTAEELSFRLELTRQRFSTAGLAPHKEMRALTSLENGLLLLLKRRRQRLVRTDEIVTALWPERGGHAVRNLRVLVSSLRRKLAQQEPSMKIVNEHGNGYRLMIDKAQEGTSGL